MLTSPAFIYCQALHTVLFTVCEIESVNNIIYKTRVRDACPPAAMQPLSMKLIIYQKQVVSKRGTEGQRVILVDKSGGLAAVIA